MFRLCLLVTSLLGSLCEGFPVVQDRATCKQGYAGAIPATRVITTQRLQNLRAQFQPNNVNAYIISSEDAHASEYTSEYDARRAYISGFTGSAGTAVVTADKAALWTDGRYFLQADEQLDCNWILMKSGQPGVPTYTEWLQQEMSRGQSVGASSYNNPIRKWISDGKWVAGIQKLKDGGVQFTPLDNDLVDAIWTTNRPAIPAGNVSILPMAFAGKSWTDKVITLRNRLSLSNITALVVTGLDETAWLFNLRGTDIPYNPFFMSYAIVEMNRVRLYVRRHTDKLREQELQNHLNTGANGMCTGKTGTCVEVKDYDSAKDDLVALANAGSTTKIWISHSCNYAIYISIPEEKRHQDSSPIALMKAVKNPTERLGMRNSHNRDAVALITFMEKLEREVKEGKTWTEVSAAAELKKYRGKQEHNRGLSFPSISGFGSNGAIIHYKPSEATDRRITTDGMYLLDSGGQYLDGTTDVTRTFHFGTPTEFEKEAYTRVLMGSIDLALLKWPTGVYGRDIDALARAPLWKVGLVYNHGTGHGIGAYLSVHEGPGRISLGYRKTAYESELYDGMFFSDEPGYYEDGKFGVRLETIVQVKYVNTTHKYKKTKFLGFEPITLVPFEPNLINKDLLNAEQITWLNNYHKTVMDVIGQRLKDEGLTAAYNWVAKRVTPYPAPAYETSQASQVTWSFLLVLLTSVSLFCRA